MNCACGKPLHYTDQNLQNHMQKLTDELGEYVKIFADSKVYFVQRHYCALHGFKPAEAPELLQKGIIKIAE